MKSVSYEKIGVIVNGPEEEYCNIEHFYPIMPLFKELGFSYIRSHSCKCNYVSATGTETSKRPNRNAIYIYDEHARPKDMKSANWVTLNRGGSLSVGPSAFGGHFGSNYESRDNRTSDVTHLNIMYNQGDDSYIHIAYYNAAKNVLYASDLTHNIGGVEVFTKVLNEVKKFNDRQGITREFIPLSRIGEDKGITFPTTLKLGLDPEFLITQNGSLTSAHLLLGTVKEGKIGTDGLREGYREIGELRPDPGTPEELVANVKELYQSLNVMLKVKANEYKVFAGGGNRHNFSLGGHIHFNMPSHVGLTQLLDDFVGTPLKSLEGATRPARRDYGRLGDVRSKPWGFEYRTPPSFIGKPDLLAGVVAVSYCLAKTWMKVVDDGSTFTYNDRVLPTDFSALEGYAKYSGEIDAFVSYITDNKSIEECDVLAAWEVDKPLNEMF